MIIGLLSKAYLSSHRDRCEDHVDFLIGNLLRAHRLQIRSEMFRSGQRRASAVSLDLLSLECFRI